MTNQAGSDADPGSPNPKRGHTRKFELEEERAEFEEMNAEWTAMFKEMSAKWDANFDKQGAPEKRRSSWTSPAARPSGRPGPLPKASGAAVNASGSRRKRR